MKHLATLRPLTSPIKTTHQILKQGSRSLKCRCNTSRLAKRHCSRSTEIVPSVSSGWMELVVGRVPTQSIIPRIPTALCSLKTQLPFLRDRSSRYPLFISQVVAPIHCRARRKRIPDRRQSCAKASQAQVFHSRLGIKPSSCDTLVPDESIHWAGTSTISRPTALGTFPSPIKRGVRGSAKRCGDQ